MLKLKNTVLIFTLICISVIYYISSFYISTSNDGSHFALLSALVEKHSTIIDDYVKYTGFTDYAVKNGHYYSDRLPGNAFLMIPFYEFGSLLNQFSFISFSKHQPIQEVTIILFSNLCSVLGIYVMYLLMIEFKFSKKLALWIAILFAFSTLTWQESTHVFSHAASMLFVLTSIFWLIKTPIIPSNYFYGFVVILAYSAVIELQNILLFAPCVIYLITTKKYQGFLFSKKNTQIAATSLFIICAIISILVIYNYVAFGEIMLKSNKYNPEFPEEMSFFTSLSGNFKKGIDMLFLNLKNPEVILNWELGTKNDIPGLFITSPILLLSSIGFYFFYKQKPHECLLFITIIGINVLIAALHKTVLVRHIFTITPFLFLPIVFLIQKINSLTHLSFKILFYIVFSCLSILSIARVFYVTHTYWGREINNVFPFVNELPVYFTFLATILFLSFIFNKILFSKKPIH